MDKIADLLIAIAIICFILLAVVIIATYFYYKQVKKVEKSLLRSSDRNANLAYLLLKNAFSSSRILRHPILTMPNGQKAQSDLILVEGGGVYVIRVKDLSGMIDNSNRSVWTVTNSNGTNEFSNPFEQNRSALNAIDYILKKEHLYNVPKHNITVFTQKRVAFKIRTERLTTAERLTETIKDINSNKFLSSREINNVIMALKKYTSK